MLDHITFGVTDFDRSVRFYDQAFAPLGVRRLFDDPSGGARATGYGDSGRGSGSPRPRRHPG